jgi:methionine-rich copper-binding protein CopC
MKILISTTLVFTLFLSTSIFAHTSLKASLPKDNAMLMSSPPNLTVTFTEPVRLVKLALNTQKGESVSFGFLPTTQPNTSFDYELSALSPGTYTAQWMLLGKDGHKMEGTFSFMVHSANSSQHDKSSHGDQHNNH